MTKLTNEIPSMSTYRSQEQSDKTIIYRNDIKQAISCISTTLPIPVNQISDMMWGGSISLARGHSRVWRCFYLKLLFSHALHLFLATTKPNRGHQ